MVDCFDFSSCSARAGISWNSPGDSKTNAVNLAAKDPERVKYE